MEKQNGPLLFAVVLCISMMMCADSNPINKVCTGEILVRMPLLMPDDFEEMHNVWWRVEQALPDAENPLLEGDMPWDAGGVGIHGAVLRDPIDGLYKAWIVSTPPLETLTDQTTGMHSVDGRTWEEVHGPIKGPFSSDVCFVYPAKFFEPDGAKGYVAYYRLSLQDPEAHVPAHDNHPGRSRTLLRAESIEGKEWINDEIIVSRDERDHRDIQYMELVPQRVPGGDIIPGNAAKLKFYLKRAFLYGYESRSWN
jgi:hypothetical protein